MLCRCEAMRSRKRERSPAQSLAPSSAGPGWIAFARLVDSLMHPSSAAIRSLHLLANPRGADLAWLEVIAMLKTALIGAGLSLCIAACTTTPAPVTAAARSPAPGCVRDTGSRIASDCPAAGREYNQQDLRTTGQTDAQQALRMLDSSVTLRGR